MNRREALQRAGLVLGYAISAPVLSGVLQGCKATPELTYKPDFFTPDQAGIVSEIAEIFIPKTDTPGAKELGVPGFIDKLVKDCFKKEDQDKFLAGIQSLDEESTKNFGDSFMDLDKEQQVAHIQKLQEAAITALKNGEVKERPFILTLKELTLVGYFTSEKGATEVLHFEAVPGAYKGCVPLSEIGKTWAV